MLIADRFFFLVLFSSALFTFFLVLFSSALSTFKSINVLYLKFERLNIPSRTTVVCDRNQGFQVGRSPSIGSSKISNF